MEMDVVHDGDTTFKLTWRMEDFISSAVLVRNFKECPSTRLISLHALGGTKWQIDVCPHTTHGWIACSFARNPQFDEEVDISFSYVIYVMRKNGAQYKKVEGTVLNCAPFTTALVNVLRYDNLPEEHLVNDQLLLVIEVRRVQGNGPVDETRKFLEDGLMLFSSHMRKLLESRYRSDFSLVADDGCQIATHAFMLLARWPELANVLRENPDENRITLQQVCSSIMTKFVRYLYTGVIPASELTTELFDFIVEQKPTGRDEFHTPFSDMSIRTQQVKDILHFTWLLDEFGGDFFRVFPLSNAFDVDVLVEISTRVIDEPKVYVVLSLWGMSPPQRIHLQCTATFFVNDSRVTGFSAGSFIHSSHTLRLRYLTPTSFLTVAPTRHRVEFELQISYRSFVTSVENTVTEFHTGSRDLSNVLLLSNDLYGFFAARPQDRKIFDVTLRSADADLYSCSAVLGIRSKVLHHWMEHRDLDIPFEFRDSNNQAVASVLEYLHTGWLVIRDSDEVYLINKIALQLRLLHLMKQCKQCIDSFGCRTINYWSF